MWEDWREWAYLALGVWTVLVLTGIGIRLVMWIIDWSEERKK